MKTRTVPFLSLRRLILAVSALIAVAGAAHGELSSPAKHLAYATAWGQGSSGQEMAQFEAWAAKYVSSSDATAKNGLQSEGLDLAKARRAAFTRLIQLNPEKALASAIPAHIREQLPAEIAEQVETRVSGIGELSVLAFDPRRNGEGPSKTVREVTVNGKRYDAYVYGRRATQGTKYGIALHGVALGNQLALHEGSVREVEASEAVPASRIAADLRNSNERNTAIHLEIGGKVYLTASAEQVAEVESRLETAEAGMGPYPVRKTAEILAALGAGIDDAPPVSPDPTTSWTVGAKQIIIIRVDFSDSPGDPVGAFDGATYTADYVHSFTDQNVDPNYRKSSYGLTSISNVVTAVYRMPRTFLDYGLSFDNTGLHSDAEAAASKDYNLSIYDRIIVLFNFSPFLGYGGLAQIGGRRVWVNGEYDFRVVNHELGHTWGLYHANLWTVSGSNPISPSGVSVEYGDDFDTMGANYADSHEVDFGVWKKNLLGWIPDNQVLDVAHAGIYRIYRFDNKVPAGPLGIKLVRNSDINYWLGYRTEFKEIPSLVGGLYVTWGYNFNQQSDLIDMVPTTADLSDAGLLIGKTLTDSKYSLTISTVAKGTDDTGPYLDVKITLPGEPPKVVNQSADAIVSEGKTAEFTVTAGSPAPNTYSWQRLPAGSSTWATVQSTPVYTGAATPALRIYPSRLAMTGDKFRCVLDGDGGMSTSSVVKLTVISNDVSTLAGKGGSAGAVDGAASNVRFNEPYGIAIAANGDSYVADTYNFTIRKITAAGVVSVFAGTTGQPGSTNGLSSESRFTYPKGVAVDASGVVYVADTGNHMVRKIDREGFVTTVAGLSGNVGSVDGQGSRARLNYPQGVAADSGGILYVADTFNHTIRRINSDGMVTTVAGVAGKSGSANGVGTNALFLYPAGLAVDASHNLYVADSGNHAIRKIDTTTWEVTTFAGNATHPGSTDATGTGAQFNAPLGVTVDANGLVFVADTGNQSIRQITPEGVVSKVTGATQFFGYLDGTYAEALFSSPASVAVDKTGNLYVADRKNEAIRLVTRVKVDTSTKYDLSVAKVAGRVVLSWPVEAKGYNLEQSEVIAPVASWSKVSTGIVTNASSITITNIPTSRSMFYRLRAAE
ncbi:MAG TPA: hypothetical protein VMF06_01060 [Candidatus Limnocylindria bacterium]|nr:hypothetical protein [Candidatus Limnocylindria bacterium]